MSQELVGVFIDVKSMYRMMYDEENKCSRNFDYSAFLQYMNSRALVVEATAYVVVAKKTDLSSLSTALTKMGYQVKRAIVDEVVDWYWNLQITADVCAAKRLDRIVLGSNYQPVIQAIKNAIPIPVDLLGPGADIDCMEFVHVAQ